MEELNKMIDCLKQHAEETFEFYTKKEKWDPSDLKSAKEAADLYDTLQTIQMNNGIWDEMQRTGDYSFARYSRISYGDSMRNQNRSYGDTWNDDRSYARGRDANTGRYVSRNDGRYYDERMDHSEARNNWGRTTQMNNGMNMSTHSVKDQAIQRLEALMDTASSEYERQEILRMIKTIEHQERA